ncbi:hypothetical protein ACLMAL_21115 [Nocardia sp. CWNU-33]|uniref:hypothetical protein n=1 Tax=Nocardia sp. CWNU-33 TaxID=3392117 RepID=UPI00398EECB6
MTVPSRRRATDLRLAVAGVLLTMLGALATGSAALVRVDRELFLRVNALPDALYRPLWLLQLTGVLGAPLPDDGSIGPDPGAVRPWSRPGLGCDTAVPPTKDR